MPRNSSSEYPTIITIALIRNGKFIVQVGHGNSQRPVLENTAEAFFALMYRCFRHMSFRDIFEKSVTAPSSFPFLSLIRETDIMTLNFSPFFRHGQLRRASDYLFPAPP